MRLGIILIEDEEDFEWYSKAVEEFDHGFDFKLVKRCVSIPDRKCEGSYIAKLPSGKVVLPNRKSNVTFEADSTYLLVDYVEMENYVIANKVYKLPKEFTNTKIVFWFWKGFLYHFEVYELEPGVYYEVRRNRVDHHWEHKYINEERVILNIGLVRERLHDYLISEISSAYDVEYTIELLGKLGYDYDVESLAKVTREKFPRVYYHYVQHYIIKEVVEKEIVEKYGVDTIIDMLGYYKIVDFSHWNQWDSTEKVLAELYYQYRANYKCCEYRPVFGEILNKIKEILKEYTIPDPTR